jgi:hypothetical protein
MASFMVAVFRVNDCVRVVAGRLGTGLIDGPERDG